MKILEPGHIYQLNFHDKGPKLLPPGKDPAWSDIDTINGYNEGIQQLVFVNREPGHEHTGTQTQEVLRALIDRTYHCDSCLPHELNAFIIHHLRMALVYHEMRALQRKAEKGIYEPELVSTGKDGHFELTYTLPTPINEAPRREFQLKPTQLTCTYREY